METKDRTMLTLTTIVSLQDVIIRRLKKPSTVLSTWNLENRVIKLKERVSFTDLREGLLEISEKELVED